MASAVIVPQLHWDPNDSKYKCCCNSCHVTSGTKAIAILGMIGCALQLLNIFGAMVRYGAQGGTFGNMIPIVLYVLVVVFLFLGVKQERPSYLIPYMVFQVLCIIGFFILFFCFIIFAIQDGDIMEGNARALGSRSSNVESTAVALCVVIAIMFFLSGLMEIWLFLVVRACYGYYKDKQLYGNQMGQGMVLPPVTTNTYAAQPPKPGYAPPAGYPPQAGYATPAGYAAPAGYAPQAGYTPQAGHTPQAGYAPPAGYAPQAGFTPQAGYAPPAGYTPQAAYAPPAGYSQPSGYAPVAGYALPPEYEPSSEVPLITEKQ